MKLIDSSVADISQTDFSEEGILKQIEKCGRISYKSEDKITDSSAKEFVERLIKLGHLTPLAFGVVRLFIPFNNTNINSVEEDVDFYVDNKYSMVEAVYNSDFKETKLNYYITTNYQVLIENERISDLYKYSNYPESANKYFYVVKCFKIICDRGVSHELVRHRSFSYVQESTRYCNYTKDKFGNELAFVKPAWWNDNLIMETKNGRLTSGNDKHFIFLKSCYDAELLYNEAIANGMIAQEARALLTNAIKTEIVMSGFRKDFCAIANGFNYKDEYIENFKGFLGLRTKDYGSKPHPDMEIIANKIKYLIDK
jgi:thymidylate synthase (FAD)